MSNALMEHPLTFLERTNYIELKGDSDEEEAIFRLNEKEALLTEFLQYTLKESGRMDFTFRELRQSYDGSFGELVLEILLVGEAERETDWVIEDVIWLGSQLLGLDVGLY